jgi:hypothetical protein
MLQTSFKNLTPLQPGRFNGHTYDIVSAFQVRKLLCCFDIVRPAECAGFDMFCETIQFICSVFFWSYICKNMPVA